jgi:hypothetical protein
MTSQIFISLLVSMQLRKSFCTMNNKERSWNGRHTLKTWNNEKHYNLTKFRTCICIWSLFLPFSKMTHRSWVHNMVLTMMELVVGSVEHYFLIPNIGGNIYYKLDSIMNKNKMRKLNTYSTFDTLFLMLVGVMCFLLDSQ